MCVRVQKRGKLFSQPADNEGKKYLYTGGMPMPSIQWNSSTINSYFKTSLNQSGSSLYDCLSDAALIKSGSYSKLMKSYYAAVKKQQTEATEETTKKATSSEKSESDSSKNITYNSNATKNQTVESLLDTLI